MSYCMAGLTEKCVFGFVVCAAVVVVVDRNSRRFDDFVRQCANKNHITAKLVYMDFN